MFSMSLYISESVFSGLSTAMARSKARILTILLHLASADSGVQTAA